MTRILIVDDSALSRRMLRTILEEGGHVVMEVNACLGTFGNMLKVQITFVVPRLQLEGLDALLSSLNIGNKEIQYALVVYTNFHIKINEITGFMVIVLGGQLPGNPSG